MGQIKQDVWEGHLSSYRSEEEFLKPFLTGFDVTWARRRRAYNTELSVYFLRPEEFLTQMFGFEHEVALFVTGYPTLEARTMQAVDTLMGEDPARGRVEQTIFFLATKDPNGRRWVSDYTSRNPQARIPVVFDQSEAETYGNDQWWVRNVLREQLFSRDLFDYQLPLDNDLFFFGRDQIIADHLDAIRRSQNRGLFGLRKTGKTSILYKLKRLVEREAMGGFLYYDCKLPSIRMLRWHELMARVVTDIAAAHGLPKPKGLNDPKRISDRLIAVLKATPEGKTTSLVFDEIEYISPLAVDDTHWTRDFVPFWQTLWAAQSQVRRLSNTVAGVNPTVVELDTINDTQNPMFGIIQPRYLKGLAPEEMRGMVRFFGKRMGLSFLSESYDYLYERYGGHPLLTRMACSATHKTADQLSLVRPTDISMKQLLDEESERDSFLEFYCRHVVSELKRFYTAEYEFLELLTSGQIVDAMELANEPEFTRHLKEYGLLTINDVQKPIIAIPVIGKYVGNELARREGRRFVRKVIPHQERGGWVARRTEMISKEIRDLGRVIIQKQLPDLYGDSSFPEPERFLNLSAAGDNDEFVTFINICNRCFVESAERVGRRNNDQRYFWTAVKKSYPDLWEALQRIKTYRNNDLHLELNGKAQEELQRYLELDLEGKRPQLVPDVWFVLQQSVLDGLLVGVQCELNRYS